MRFGRQWVVVIVIEPAAIRQKPNTRASRATHHRWVDYLIEKKLLEARDFEGILIRYQPMIDFYSYGVQDDVSDDLKSFLRFRAIKALHAYVPRSGLVLFPFLKSVLSRAKIDFVRLKQHRWLDDERISDSEPAPHDDSLLNIDIERITRAFNHSEMCAVSAIVNSNVPKSWRASGLSRREFERTQSRVRYFLQARLGDHVVLGSMQQLFDLVPAPAKDSINTGLSPASAKTLTSLLGEPRELLTADCKPITNKILASRMVYAKSVGPFKVAGEKLAVQSLTKVMKDIEAHCPEVYSELGSAGMLCCRLVRGSKIIPSNHSWGTAVDLTISGRLDPRGDDKVQRGLLAIYRYFHKHGWFWGAEFRVEDAMHFELSQEKIIEFYGSPGSN